MKTKILAISGSPRKGSSNEKILQNIAKLYHDQIDIDIYTNIHQLPPFNPDVNENQLHPTVMKFIDKIKNADGILISTPEYVFSLPGMLKNALEWTVNTTVFSFKPSAFIIAAASGEKAFEELDLILYTLTQRTIPADQKLLVKGGQHKLTGEGGFANEQLKLDIQSCINSLISAIRANRY